MRLVKSSVEIWEQEPGFQGILKQIERVGRTCYASNDKIGPGTAEKFVGMLIRAGHGKALEQGTVYLLSDDKSTIEFYRNNPYSRIVLGNHGESYITTNYRVIIDNSRESDIDKYLCDKPLPDHELRVTAHFICDRGVSAEANRHTSNSSMESSTRYCNYSKGKFGGEISIIEPDEFEDGTEILFHDKDLQSRFHELSRSSCDSWGSLDWWMLANEVCELSYMKLLGLGWKPQQARRVLPLDLKTEDCQTAFIYDTPREKNQACSLSGWQNFFKLRCDKQHAHPDIVVLADHLRELMKKYD